MKRLLASVILLAALAAIAPGFAAASEPPSEKSVEEQRRQLTFNVDFPGGTLAQLANSIHPPGGPAFNLIGEKDALALQVPPLSLRNVDTESLASALRILVSPRGFDVMRAQGPMFGPGLVNLPVYVVAQRSANAGQPVAFESYPLAPFLQKLSVDDIISAIRTAWELSPTHRPEELTLKFHPPTGILLVSGSGEALSVARSVINSLKPGLDSKPKTPPPAAEKP